LYLFETDFFLHIKFAFHFENNALQQDAI